jgi:GNAT superfamily N-acetyltransferase
MCESASPPAPEPAPAPPAAVRRKHGAAGRRPQPNRPGCGRHEQPRPPHGELFAVRELGPEDRAAALALHNRCSPETLRDRYHGPVADADRYLGHLLDPRHGRTLAVEREPGRPVAIGHLLWDGPETEVALLVEDAWQRLGIGTLLLHRLVALARSYGRGTVYAVTRRSDRAVVPTMRRLGLPLELADSDGSLVVTASLPRTGNSPNALEVAAPK